MTNDHINNCSPKIINACINCIEAIESSTRHFIEVKKSMQALSISLQEDISNSQFESNELVVNKINYIAVLALEKLGMTDPSQEQINTMEFIILFANYPESLAFEKINA